LRPYRSTDWQVVESELIILGEVTNVAALEDPQLEHFGDVKGVPATLDVKVEKTLKGRPPDGPLRVKSGPIESCYPGAVFADLYKGDRVVFMLPPPKVDGVYCLRWGGCVHRADRAPEIEERIARAVRFRDDHLAALGRDRPETLARAEELHRQLSELAAHWPREGEWGPEVVQAALAAVHGHSIEEISTATVLDLSDGLMRTWSGVERWKWHVFGGNDNVRKDELREYDGSVVQRRLLAVGIPEEEIKLYLEPPVDDAGAQFGYPFPARHWPRRDLGTSATADFLLHAGAYDRGMLWARYAMGVDLSGLDGKLAEQELRRLWASGDEDSRHAVNLVIRATRGTEFVDLILESILAGSPRDWWWLENSADATVLPKRLHALVELARGGGRHEVWAALAEGGCFNPESLKEAVERLEAIEFQTSALAGPEPDAICAFLDKALVALGGTTPETRSAASYRKQWQAAPRQRDR